LGFSASVDHRTNKNWRFPKALERLSARKELSWKRERKKEVDLFAKICLYSRTVLSGVQLKSEVVENEIGQVV